MPGGFESVVGLKMNCCKVLSILFLCVTFSAASALADLNTDIKRVLSNRLLAKATVGVQVVRLTDQPENCQLLFEHNARTPLIPASNMKLVTTSAALHVLTPEFRFRTMLVKRGDDLIIWGDGDPTIGDPELMDTIGWSQTAVFEEWIRQLKTRGITTVNRVIVDDSIFDEQFLHPRWEKHQFTPSGAEVGGLNFGANLVEFTVTARKGMSPTWTIRPQTSYIRVKSNSCTNGSTDLVSLPRGSNDNNFVLRGTIKSTAIATATIHDPGMYGATAFADLLRANGFAIGGILRDRSTRQAYADADPATRDQQWQVLCIFETPLTAVVSRCNKESQNMYAEALVKRMGAASGAGGTWATGAAVVSEFLRKLGVSDGEFRLDDGSGLSRENLVTAHALMRCLLNDYYSPNRETFISSLPVGNVDGTLRKRFDSDLRGRVFAKTGFIANVSSLSGFLKTRGGEWYAFTILMNGIPDFSNSSIKPLQEQIVEAIDEAATQSAKR